MRCVFSSEAFSQVRNQSQSTLKLLKISSRDFSVKLEASCSSAGRRLHLVTKNHRFYVSKSLTKALRSYQTPETYLETIQNTLKLFENIYYKGWRFSGTSCRFFSILVAKTTHWFAKIGILISFTLTIWLHERKFWTILFMKIITWGYICSVGVYYVYFGLISVLEKHNRCKHVDTCKYEHWQHL